MPKKITTRLRIDFQGAKGALKEEIKKEVGELLIKEVNSDLDASRSPVKDGSFKKNKKRTKGKKGSGGPSRLFESGDMRASITFEEFRDGIEFGIFEQEQANKADNHNKNSAASKKTLVPRREFIPKEGQTFREPILNRIKKLVSEAVKDGSED